MAMRKKLVMALCAAVMTLCIAGCSGGGAAGGNQAAESNRSDGKSAAAPASQPQGSIPAGELEAVVTADVESVVAALNAEYEVLATDIDAYEKYVGNVEAVEAFYAKTLEETENLGIRLRQYSVDCATAVFASDRTNGQKYDDFEVVYDIVYEDARDEIYDEIYDGILKNMYGLFYDGILKDAYDSVGYGEWSEVLSHEYDLWSDTCSDVYDAYSDLSSDIYGFYSDVRSELYGDDLERARKKTGDFQEDIDSLRA